MPNDRYQPAVPNGYVWFTNCGPEPESANGALDTLTKMGIPIEDTLMNPFTPPGVASYIAVRDTHKLTIDAWMRQFEALMARVNLMFGTSDLS